MKENTSSRTKTHLIRGAFYVLLLLTGTLLAFVRPATQTNAPPRTLTFAERVIYQRGIEDVYWRHRIWPKENPQPKPSLDAVISQGQLEQKVEDYLRKSQLITDQRQSLIPVTELQAEMERMASHTKQPEVLRELFEALGNDPFVIAECLARPAVVDRLVTTFSGNDQDEFDTSRARAKNDGPKVVAPASDNYKLPPISDAPNGCTDDTWTPTSVTNAPSAREYQTAVWTGSEMIVWGGNGFGSLNTGGRYNPSMDNWTATSTTNAPIARFEHTAVWTGSEMIVWGGSTALNTGGRYNPTTDTWASTSTTNAPSGRYYHTAVWTGSEMIIWGGTANPTYFNTGGRYNANTNSWTPTTTINAPDARSWHTAVWTGSQMIVWGGWNASTSFNTGGTYNPGTNSWTATATTGAPDPRIWHTAVWTGSDMIIWGGSVVGASNTGGRYSPDTNSWVVTSTTNAPSARVLHTVVWSGNEMIVWGGSDSSTPLNTGGRYSPLTDSWTATTINNAPSARFDHTAVWSGIDMIAWGGADFNGNPLNTGGRYCAQSAASTPTPTPTATPSPTPMACSVTSSLCGDTVFVPPTDFVINMIGIVDPGTVDASDLMVNNLPASSFVLINGNTTIIFHFNSSPVTQSGVQTMHIPACAFSCGKGCVQKFTCTFTYQPSTPTPTATAMPTVTPQPTATATFTPTPTPNGCSVVSTFPACGSVVMGSAPTDFTVQLSDAIDQATLQASDFMVNGTDADSVIVISGEHIMFFHFNISPAIQGQNTMHIPAGAFSCSRGPVQEFTCTFTFQPSTPTPRPSPTPRVAPTPRVRPTPPPRP